MATTKLVGIILIVLGTLGLMYGGFSYTKDTTAVKLGSMELKVQEKQNVAVPLVISVGAIGIGIFLLLTGRNK